MSGEIEVKLDDAKTEPVNSLAVVVLGWQEKREVYCEPASSTTDWHGITSPIDILGKTLGGDRVFDTRAHKEIYSILFGQLKNLTDGKYVNTQGVCCSTMVGAKGIGKTTCLKSFTTLAKYIRANAFVVYLSYDSVNVQGSRLMSSSLSTIIQEELLSQGLEMHEDIRCMLCENILTSLENAGKYLLLLVDGLDQLYKLDGKVHSSATATVHELAYYGSQPSGAISVLVCGSSSLMQNLITTNASEQIRLDFPLLSSGAISLNGTKYAMKRVYSTLPTDLESVHSIVGMEGTLKSSYTPLYRLIAYMTGCSPRNVTRLLNDADDQSLVLSSVSPENFVTDVNKFATKTASNLYVAVLKALVKKNHLLLSTLFGTSTRTSSEIIRNIATVAWETSLKPLDYSDVERIWNKMEKKKKQVEGDLCYYLLLLRDRCWLTLSGIRNSNPECIYPFSLSSIGIFVMSSNNAEAISIQIVELVRNTPENILNVVSSPQFLGRTTQAVVTTIAAPSLCNLL